MTKDDFKQTLIRQYTEVIDEMIVESETVYRSHLNVEELDFKVKSLIRAAQVDGLEETIIYDLIERKVPNFRKLSISKAA